MEDGKVVNSIVIEAEHGNGVYRIKNTVEKENGLALICEIKFHGDHQCEWIVQLDKKGNEKRRFNMSYIQEIEWLR